MRLQGVRIGEHRDDQDHHRGREVDGISVDSGDGNDDGEDAEPGVTRQRGGGSGLNRRTNFAAWPCKPECRRDGGAEKREAAVVSTSLGGSGSQARVANGSCSNGSRDLPPSAAPIGGSISVSMTTASSGNSDFSI